MCNNIKLLKVSKTFASKFKDANQNSVSQGHDILAEKWHTKTTLFPIKNQIEDREW